MARFDGPRPPASSAGASATGRANRRTDTRPERLARSMLHRRGLRFRKDFPIALERRRVRPDIVFLSRKLAVFIDGCFWHCCPEHAVMPKANRDYWEPKLRRNVERDLEVDLALEAEGWRVLRIWEHVPIDEAVSQIVTAVNSASTTHEQAP